MKDYESIGLRNYSYVFNFEKEFVFEDSLQWMIKNWTYGIHFVAAYVLIIFGGKHLMKDKPRFNLRSVLVLWNVSLAAFSIMGAIRTIPEFSYSLSKYGFYYSVCVPSFVEVDRVSGFWTWLFTLSKVVELGDTVFIILRKQNLIFLHWYHHITALLYVWYSYTEVPASARWFMVMNYSVHSLMYSYYALKAMRYNPPRQIAMVITTLQICQMVIASAISLWALHLLNNNVGCRISYRNIKISLVMYLSYFVLFANFFYNSYILGRKKLKLKTDVIEDELSSSKSKVN